MVYVMEWPLLFKIKIDAVIILFYEYALNDYTAPSQLILY